MNRYLLSVGQNYYPEGGGEDAFGLFASIDEAKAALPLDRCRYPRSWWANILDLESGEVVARFSRSDDEPWDDESTEGLRPWNARRPTLFGPGPE